MCNATSEAGAAMDAEVRALRAEVARLEKERDEILSIGVALLDAVGGEVIDLDLKVAREMVSSGIYIHVEDDPSGLSRAVLLENGEPTP